MKYPVFALNYTNKRSFLLQNFIYKQHRKTIPGRLQLDAIQFPVQASVYMVGSSTDTNLAFALVELGYVVQLDTYYI